MGLFYLVFFKIKFVICYWKIFAYVLGWKDFSYSFEAGFGEIENDARKQKYCSKAASCHYSWEIDHLEVGPGKSCRYNGCIPKFGGSYVNWNIIGYVRRPERKNKLINKN